MYSLCPLHAFPNPSAIIFLSSLSSNPSGSVFKAHSCLRAFTLLVFPAGYALPSNVPISILWKSVQVSPSQRWASLKTTLSNYHFSLSEVICICTSSIQFSCSVVSNSLWPHGHSTQASLSITNSRNLLRLMSIESVMPSNHLILCRSLLLSPSVFPRIRVFSNESVLPIRWPKY